MKSVIRNALLVLGLAASSSHALEISYLSGFSECNATAAGAGGGADVDLWVDPDPGIELYAQKFGANDSYGWSSSYFYHQPLSLGFNEAFDWTNQVIGDRLGTGTVNHSAEFTVDTACVGHIDVGGYPMASQSNGGGVCDWSIKLIDVTGGSTVLYEFNEDGISSDDGLLHRVTATVNLVPGHIYKMISHIGAASNGGSAWWDTYHSSLSVTLN